MIAKHNGRLHKQSIQETTMLMKIAKDPMRLFDDIWSGTQMPAAPSFKVDISEDEQAFHIDAELPGLTKENISLNIEDDVLTIKAERSQSDEQKKKDYHRVERSYGSFSRSFNIGELVDQEHIGAAFDNGVLHITLPKMQPVKKTKEISII
jgi:HSP20 family protein